MRKQDGSEYKPDALMGMVTSAMRAYSSTAQDKALAVKASPPPKLTLKDSPLLYNNLTAVMKQLHKQGLHSQHQEELSAAEYQLVLEVLKNLPPSSFLITMRGFLILASNWGGRNVEYHVIKRE
jgi:hypothetical protein